MARIQGKVVWITGASSGIGEALTYELARRGNKLILSSRRREELERVRGNCPAVSQSDIKILPLDLSASDSLKQVTSAALQLFGHVDILINNGGISQRSLAKDTTLEVDRRLMEVDYFGTIALTKYLLPHFIARKSGHFVTVTSVTGVVATPHRSGYSAAKHALHGFFDALRAELWKESPDIHVTLICPGWVRTSISINALTGDGSLNQKMDTTTAKGIDPAVLARKAVRAIENHKDQVYIAGLKERSAVIVKRLCPWLFARILRTARVR